MDLIVLNQNFEAISVIDNFESVIWTDRYDQPGEFEIYTPVNESMLTYPVVDNYIRIDESEHLMIIEDITIESDVENGNHIKIVGRSLESILDRRVVSGELNVSGSIQTTIKNLINSNIISPSDSSRKIDNFIFEDSTDTNVTSLTYSGQFKGQSLLEIIETICQTKDVDLGFKVILNDENQFVFSLYKGTDRSYRQEVLPYVCFKPSLENIFNSNYSEVHSSSKNVIYVHASYSEEIEYEEDGKTRTKTEQRDLYRTVGSGTGLSRRELYLDSSVSKDEDMDMGTFTNKVDQSGTDELKNRKVQKTFEGECETTRMYVYDRDFFMGDVVQVANEYNKEDPARVMEFIWSQSSSELKNYPTFKALDYAESEES